MPPGFPKPAILFAMVAAAVVVLAGCGGDGGDETTAAPVEATEAEPALTKADLIAQGDAICAEVNAAVGSLDAGETEATDQASQVADLYGGMVERLQALGTPDEAEGYEEFADSADELAQAASDAELASARGDEEGLVVAQEDVSSSLAEFQEAAASYGFEDCAEAPSAPEATLPGGDVPGGEEEVAPEEVPPEEEVAPEEVAPEEVAPETGGAGGTGGGTVTPGGEEGGGASGGIGPG